MKTKGSIDYFGPVEYELQNDHYVVNIGSLCGCGDLILRDQRNCIIGACVCPLVHGGKALFIPLENLNLNRLGKNFRDLHLVANALERT